MPLDDQVKNSEPVSNPSNKGVNKKLKATNGKDQIIVNPDMKDIIQEGETKSKTVAVLFGRMNPPTKGHEENVNGLKKLANEHNADHLVIASHSHDTKKNPLSSEQKTKHLKRAFPDTHITTSSKEAPSIFHHLSNLHKQGYKHVIIAGGEDRAEEYNKLKDYNGKEGKHGYYKFDSIESKSTGERKEGISGTAMREHAKNNNFDSFRKNLPSKLASNEKHAREVFDDTREGLNVNESFEIFERVVSLQQRRKRSVQMKRMSSRLARARKISRMRQASPEQLKRRAYQTAKQNIRRRFAGFKGAEYQEIGTSDKIMVDKLIDPKVKNIKNIVKRIMPRVRQADVKRLQAFRAGKQYVKGPLPQFNSYSIDQEKFNQLYEMVIGSTNSEALNESFGAFYTARDLGMKIQGGFALHPSVQDQLDESAASHMQQASILSKQGKNMKASIHRRIADALNRGDMTTARSLSHELKSVKE